MRVNRLCIETTQYPIVEAHLSLNSSPSSQKTIIPFPPVAPISTWPYDFTLPDKSIRIWLVCCLHPPPWSKLITVGISISIASWLHCGLLQSASTEEPQELCENKGQLPFLLVWNLMTSHGPHWSQSLQRVLSCGSSSSHTQISSTLYSLPLCLSYQAWDTWCFLPEALLPKEAVRVPSSFCQFRSLLRWDLSSKIFLVASYKINPGTP